MEDHIDSENQIQPKVDTHDGQQQQHNIVEQSSENTDLAETNIAHEKPLSKNQQKRMRRHEQWLENKAEKRFKEKEKKKRKMAEARERGETLGPTRKTLKKNSMANSGCKIRVCVDCSFDEYMNEKDVMKLVKQMQHCYSVNRRAANPLQFYVSSTTDKTKERLDMIGDYKNWDIYFKEEHYMKTFDLSDVVYLSSESPNVLTELDSTKAYIIGGLVDHNHHKGLCHELAADNKIDHAQLPISDYIEMKSRKVLTVDHDWPKGDIDHGGGSPALSAHVLSGWSTQMLGVYLSILLSLSVFEILLQFTETNDWKSAFFNVIPQRKTFAVKGVSNEKNCEDDSANSCAAANPVNTELEEDKSSLKGDNLQLESSGGDVEFTGST